jgi:hypothetical protein
MSIAAGVGALEGALLHGVGPLETSGSGRNGAIPPANESEEPIGCTVPRS